MLLSGTKGLPGKVPRLLRSISLVNKPRPTVSRPLFGREQLYPNGSCLSLIVAVSDMKQRFSDKALIHPGCVFALTFRSARNNGDLTIDLPFLIGLLGAMGFHFLSENCIFCDYHCYMLPLFLSCNSGTRSRRSFHGGSGGAPLVSRFLRQSRSSAI